jgi:transposase-like protein
MLTTGNGTARPDPEVLEKARRRRFTAEYKARVLREYDASPKGERGALLRREGLYSSHIASWQSQRSKGAISALEPKKRGRKPTKRRDDVALENARLHRQVARLEHELAYAKKVIHVQKKVSELLGVEQPPLPDELKDEDS